MQRNNLTFYTFAVLAALAVGCGGREDAGPGAGHLTVAVEGLEAGQAADLFLTGPDGMGVAVTETETLQNLTAGEYTLSANPVVYSKIIYDPNQPTQTFAVVAGEIGFAEVAYNRAAYQDAQGDALAVSGTRWDAQATHITRLSDALEVTFSFGQDVVIPEPTVAPVATDLIGYIELDLDQNGTTGAPSIIDGACPTTLGLGFEYIVAMTVTDADGKYAVLDETMTEVGRTLPAVQSNELTIQLPYAMIGDVDGPLDTVSVFGNTDGGVTDCSPDGSALAL